MPLLPVQYNRSALLLGEAFKLEPGLREKFQILYKASHIMCFERERPCIFTYILPARSVS